MVTVNDKWLVMSDLYRWLTHVVQLFLYPRARRLFPEMVIAMPVSPSLLASFTRTGC